MGCVAYNIEKQAAEIKAAAEKPIDLEKYKTRRSLGKPFEQVVAESRNETTDRLTALFRGDHHG